MLSYLAGQKRKDAETLFRQHRNTGAFYLMGYALELNLKRKVCQSLGFNRGFPETKAELQAYSIQISLFNSINAGITLTQIKQVKNHDLSQLLIFSGAETRIINLFLQEWLTIKAWNPENRYRIQRFSDTKAERFMKAAKLILKQIT